MKISVNEAEDLGAGNFLVRLSVGNGDAEITHTDIVSAEGRDAAIQKAKLDFARWLKMAFAIASKRAA